MNNNNNLVFLQTFVLFMVGGKIYIQFLYFMLSIEINGGVL